MKLGAKSKDVDNFVDKYVANENVRGGVTARVLSIVPSAWLIDVLCKFSANRWILSNFRNIYHVVGSSWACPLQRRERERGEIEAMSRAVFFFLFLFFSFCESGISHIEVVLYFVIMFLCSFSGPCIISRLEAIIFIQWFVLETLLIEFQALRKARSVNQCSFAACSLAVWVQLIRSNGLCHVCRRFGYFEARCLSLLWL